MSRPRHICKSFPVEPLKPEQNILLLCFSAEDTRAVTTQRLLQQKGRSVRGTWGDQWNCCYLQRCLSSLGQWPQCRCFRGPFRRQHRTPYSIFHCRKCNDPRGFPTARIHTGEHGRETWRHLCDGTGDSSWSRKFLCCVICCFPSWSLPGHCRQIRGPSLVSSGGLLALGGHRGPFARAPALVFNIGRNCGTSSGTCPGPWLRRAPDQGTASTFLFAKQMPT